MKLKTILSFILYFALTNMYGQSKYCNSYTDYMNDNWTPIDSLTISTRSNGQKVWSGGADFKPETGNKDFDIFLKKQVRFIIHNDTLYVNCKGLKYQGCVLGNWYAPGFRYGKDKICFICMKTGKKELREACMSGALGGAFGGALGGALIGAANAIEQVKKRTCYFINSDERKISRITGEYMEELLSPHPELLDNFTQMEKEEKESAKVIIEYLNLLQLLSKY